MTLPTGIALLASFGLAMLAITFWTVRRHDVRDKASFLVADRSVGKWSGALSLSVSWIWAPALFVSAQVAYNWGWPGLFYFMFGNTLALVVFGFAARKLRQMMPNGFTFSGYIRQRFSARAQTLYVVQFIIVAVCAFGVQLLAGGKVVSMLTGVPYEAVVVTLGAIPLTYSLWAGLRGSINSDMAQQLVLYGGVLVIVPWVVIRAGADSFKFDGMDGGYTSILSGSGAALFLTYGFSQFLAHIAGGFGDQMFWQRAWAIRQQHVLAACVRGALLFAIVPISLSLLGFVAFNSGVRVEGSDTQFVNLETVETLLPAWAMIPFALLLLSGLMSTLDSALCAVSALASHDGERLLAHRQRAESTVNTVRHGRIAMVLLATGGVGIALIPGMQILYLMLFFGTVRAATMIPTLLSLFWKRVQEQGVFWGILAAFCIGLPIFTYGNFGGGSSVALAGSLITLALSGLLCYAISLFVGGREDRDEPPRPPAVVGTAGDGR